MRPVNERQREWGRNIKAQREALGLGQKDLAYLLGVNQGTVSRWESGRVAPRDDHKVQIATVLHIDARMLFPLVRAS